MSVLKKAGGWEGGLSVGGEMNLGKMGIQICEKLGENLGWRQIGWCQKWDRKAPLRGPPGDRSDMHCSSTAPSIRPRDPSEPRHIQELTAEIKFTNYFQPVLLFTLTCGRNVSKKHVFSSLSNKTTLKKQNEKPRKSTLWITASL